MLKKLFMASLAVSMILGGVFTSCNMDDDDDDDEEEAISNTYELSSLYGKAFEDTTNGVGFAIIDESNYIWFHNNSSYTGTTPGTYTATNTASNTYVLTSASGTVYTVKVTSNSAISLTLASSHNTGTYEMTHVFSSLFGNTYSGTQGQMTHTLSITDSANCTYKATTYMPNETAYTYTITGVTADNTAKTLTYTMQWYKDGDKKGTHTVLITDAGITFDSLALTKSE